MTMLDLKLRSRQLSLANKPGLFVLIDEDLYEDLSRHSWHCNSLGYCIRRVHSPKRNQGIYLHRQIMGVHDGTAPHLMVDHINGDRLDNRRSNLRLATKAQNMRNRGATKANTSGYKGVTYHAQSKKWKAYIKVDYRQIYLGLFSTPREAARAYNTAALSLHGEFAYLNQV